VSSTRIFNTFYLWKLYPYFPLSIVGELEARIWFQGKPCEILDEPNGFEIGFSPATSIFLRYLSVFMYLWSRWWIIQFMIGHAGTETYTYLDTKIKPTNKHASKHKLYFFIPNKSFSDLNLCTEIGLRTTAAVAVDILSQRSSWIKIPFLLLNCIVN
jgi:hypothetical protein